MNLISYVSGLGSSLISAQVEAIIFDTYDSRLGIIRGVCLTGQAVGQSLFPHIIAALIDQYGYSYAYIVLSGIILQTLPAIMLLKIDDNIKGQFHIRDIVIYLNLMQFIAMPLIVIIIQMNCHYMT